MKKLLALLLALTLCATAAFAEEGVFDYTVFEGNGDIGFEIDHFDNEWTAYIPLMSTIADAPMSFSAMGAVDGGVIMVFLYVNGPCEEVKVQADDTVYTFDTALQAILLDSSGVGLMLTPEMEPFFRALATAKEVNVRVTLERGRDRHQYLRLQPYGDAVRAHGAVCAGRDGLLHRGRRGYVGHL